MDLNTLAARLREQATRNSTIELDADVLPDAVRENVRLAFALGDTNLKIANVKAADIPDPTADGVLIVPKGKASVLKQDDVDVGLTFTAANGTIEAVIVAEMGDSWEFSDSYAGLAEFPFNQLEIRGPRFVYTTFEQRDYAWPNDSSYKIQLERDLNFLAHVTLKNLSSIPSPVRELIGNVSLKLYGSLTPKEGQHWPVGTLRAPITVPRFEIGTDPIKLSLGGPKLALRIGEATDEFPIQEIDLLVESEFQKSLQVTVGIPIVGNALEVSIKPLSPDQSAGTLIKLLPGGGEFMEFVPNDLRRFFGTVGLKNFSMMVTSDRRVTYVGLTINTVQTWKLIEGILELKNLTLEIEAIEPSGMNWSRAHIAATAKFLPAIFTDKDEFAFTVKLEKQNSWEIKSIDGAYYGSVSLGKIVRGLSGSAVNLPPALSGIQFADFGLSAYKVGDDFTYRFYGSVEAAIPILGRELIAALHLTVTKSGARHTVHIGGGLAIGEQVFSLSLDVDQSNSELEAGWEGTALGFGDIANAFGWDSMPQLPEGLDLALKKVNFIYDFKNETVVLRAKSVNYGEIVFASLKKGGNRIYVFSVDIPLDLKFSKLPVVGESLKTDTPIGIDELEIVAASADLEDTDVSEFNKLTETLRATPLIAKLLGKGLTIAAKLQMQGPHEVVLPLTGTPKSVQAESPATTDALAPAETQPAALTATTYNADAKWFELKKTLGPVYFDKVGVQYQDSTLRFLLNAALSAAGLTLSVDGLSVGSRLTNFKPTFELQGLGIDYKAGDIEIGGAFLRTVKAGKEDSYDGAAVIKTKQFAVSALGSYTKLGGEASLFIYAFLDYPLGGPTFFFVTGLAAGFGYNRRLIAPSIEKVAEFPLITQAVRGRKAAPENVMDALQSLQQYVPPNVGSVFLAVGVKFNSFKLIDSFALLTIEFGNNFVINLLGVSKAVVPTPEAGKAVTPLAQVEIAWKATFDPDQGCLGIDARLTSNSYILSKDCRLSGGYAFYSWFSGPHAGDFVQTLGGYHKDFNVPAHYPKVPRLAFDWRVSNALTIQGNAYYALTGSALMAGGHLEVLFRQGELRAWLKVDAHFLIAWKPYHYDAFLSVNVGASYTFNINLLFTRVRVTISVDVGAQLHLWGPDFSGTARIDLSVISFTIAFGAGASQAPAEIKEWSTFQQSFLPAKDVCSISVRAGLVKKIEDGGKEHWIINAKQLSLVVDSAIPFKSAAAIGKEKKSLAIDNPNLEFGVGPMAVAPARLTSELTVTVKRGGSPVDGELKYTVTKKTVPRGLWGEKVAPDVNHPFIERVPSGVEITPARQPDPGETATIDPKVFKFSDIYYGPDGHAYQWGTGGGFVPSADVTDAQKRKALIDSIESNPDRASLLKALGMTTVTVNVRKEFVDDLLSMPQVGTL